MREIIPNLFEIRAQNVPDRDRPFNYLLVRPPGNILLTSLPFENRLDDHFNAISGKGELLVQFLGDRHNASSGCDDVRKVCGGKIITSDVEGKVIQKKGLMLDELLKFGHQKWAADFETIPFPGHTPGQLVFLWSGSTEKCLFVGDAFVPSLKGWEFYVKKKDYDTMAKSIESLNDVDFDRILFSSFTVVGDPSIYIEKKYREKFLKSLVQSLRSGSLG